jgi:cyanophycinase-like exopeptidase
MRPSTRATRTLALGLLATALLGASTGAAAADPVTTTLVPIGSDYQADTLRLFAREAAERPGADDDQVHILVLPITYSLSADGTTKSERKKNLTFAENRRSQINAACEAVKAPEQTCLTELVPVLVRSDAKDFDPAPYFTADLDGMYVLGGDQTVAMETVHDTPLEDEMSAAFEEGAVFGGNSAGDAVQSTDMINGYNGGNGPAESLQENAVQVCYDADVAPACEGGLPFGFANLITDQHVFEYGRTGRSLNVAVSTGKPVLGMDAATGAVVDDYTSLHDVTGDTLGYVIDPTAYGSPEAYGGPNASLRTANVAMHLLPPGSGFDFGTMTPDLDGTEYPQPNLDARDYPISATGAGTLYLAGGIVGDPAGLVGDAFVADAGGAAANIVVLAAGFAKSGDAQTDAKAIAAAIAPEVTSVSWFALDSRTKNSAAIAAINDATGIIVTGRDRSVVLDQLGASPAWDRALERWTAGLPLLADNAAAAAAGMTFVAQAPAADVESGATEDAIVDNVTIAGGLGLVSGLAVEPRLLPDQLWPQLFQITRASGGDAVGAGIDVGTAIRVDGTSATAIGDSAVVIVDGRDAAWTVSEDNGAIGAAWLIVDTFANGNAVAPVAP